MQRRFEVILSEEIIRRWIGQSSAGLRDLLSIWFFYGILGLGAWSLVAILSGISSDAVGGAWLAWVTLGPLAVVGLAWFSRRAKKAVEVDPRRRSNLIEIDDETFSVSNELDDSRYRWSDLTTVHETRGEIGLCFLGDGAHIIPNSLVDEELR